MSGSTQTKTTNRFGEIALDYAYLEVEDVIRITDDPSGLEPEYIGIRFIGNQGNGATEYELDGSPGGNEIVGVNAFYLYFN